MNYTGIEKEHKEGNREKKILARTRCFRYSADVSVMLSSQRDTTDSIFRAASTSLQVVFQSQVYATVLSYLNMFFRKLSSLL